MREYIHNHIMCQSYYTTMFAWQNYVRNQGKNTQEYMGDN